MTTDKRRRELARAKAERQAQRRAEASARARRNRLIGLLAAGAVVTGAVVWAAWPDSTEQAGAEATPEAEGSPTPDESASPTAEATPGPVATPAGVTCTEPGAPRNDGRTWDKPADQNLSGTVDWILNTNCGRITVALDAQAAPKNVNALAFLTDQGYYSGNFCHRLTTAGIFVLQCGSPGADGTGETGFTVPDENLLMRAKATTRRAPSRWPIGARTPPAARSSWCTRRPPCQPATPSSGRSPRAWTWLSTLQQGAWRRDHRMRPMDHRHNPS